MSELTFVVPTHDDAAQLEFCLVHLRAAYPDVPVLVFLDFEHDSPGLEGVAARYGTDVHRGRVLGISQGAKSWERFLEAFLATDAAFLARIDTDSLVFRPFRELLDAPAWGCIRGAFGIRYLHGGCQVLRRDVCERLLVEARKDEWRDPRSWCPREGLPYQQARGVVSMDFLLGAMLERLDVPIRDSLEVWSVGALLHPSPVHTRSLALVDNADRRFAVTHPWKLGRLRAAP